jgi:hypothetical protein
MEGTYKAAHVLSRGYSKGISSNLKDATSYNWKKVP